MMFDGHSLGNEGLFKDFLNKRVIADCDLRR